jgi:hypothetical protein
MPSALKSLEVGSVRAQVRTVCFADVFVRLI